MYSPFAASSPEFRAALTPAFFRLWITRTRSSRAAKPSHRAGELSRQPSSTSSSSQSEKVWDRTLSTEAFRNFSA